jgi:hypothetical protein
MKFINSNLELISSAKKQLEIAEENYENTLKSYIKHEIYGSSCIDEYDDFINQKISLLIEYHNYIGRWALIKHGYIPDYRCLERLINIKESNLDRDTSFEELFEGHEENLLLRIRSNDFLDESDPYLCGNY